MESGTVRVDVPEIALLVYQIPTPAGKDTTRVRVIQAASPSITLPPGTDLRVWGQTMFQVLGMSEDQARQMAQNIDWSSTMIVPLPRDAASFKEVQINGASGLIVEESRHEHSFRQRTMLLWTQGEVVYSVQGEHILSSSLLQIAQSLR